MPSEKAKLYIDRLGGGGTPELARDIETAFRIVEGFKAKAAKIKSDTSRTAAGHGIEIGRVFSGGYLDHLRQLRGGVAQKLERLRATRRSRKGKTYSPKCNVRKRALGYVRYPTSSASR